MLANAVVVKKYVSSANFTTLGDTSDATPVHIYKIEMIEDRISKSAIEFTFNPSVFSKPRNGA